MKPLLPIFLWLWSSLAIAQAKEVSSAFVKTPADKFVYKKDTAKAAYLKTTAAKPEIFTSCLKESHVRKQ